MYYFVGGNLGNKLTGIEKAQLNRLKLFEENGMLAKCLFVKWNPILRYNASLFEISNKVLSIYDVFQNSLSDNYTYFDWIKYWQENNYTIKKVNGTHDVRVYKDEKYIIYAHFFDKSLNKISYINYFDTNQKKIKRELFDYRGFKSVTKILTTNQKVVAEFYHNQRGEICIEKYFDVEKDNQLPSRIILKSENDDLFFESEEQLIAKGIELLYQKGDIYFSDKNLLTAPAFNFVNIDIPVYAVLHSTHLKDMNNQDFRLKNTYKGIFNNLSRYKGIIVSTNAQKDEVKTYIEKKIPVYDIPVGFVENIKSDWNYQKNGEIISISRYSPEKQLTHQIELIERLKPDFPDIKLSIFGHGPEYNKLKELIEEKNLQNNVLLKGFVKDLTSVYKNAKLSLLTSNMEGFSLAVLESMSYGVPVVSYDIKYGPSEMITNDQDGLLVTLNDIDELYTRVKSLLNNNDLLIEFSKNSIQSVESYKRENIFKKWKNLLVAANKDGKGD